MTLKEKFQKTLNENIPDIENRKVLLAVSGGVDSIVLLHLFHSITETYQLKLKILHLNHGIRLQEADRDENFVKQLGESYKIPVITKTVNVPEYANRNKYSIEEAARELRYQFFEEELSTTNFNYVALAHHMNDQAETLLDHFIRGSGVRGLTGMTVKNGPYIRPLLEITRNEIETYASENGLNYIIDSSNQNTRYRRNKIRHKLIPYLIEEFNPSIVNSLSKTSRIFQDTDRYLQYEAKKAFHHCLKKDEKEKIILDINQFFKYFNIIQVYVLYHILKLLVIDIKKLDFHKIITFLELIKKNRSGNRLLIDDEWEILIDHDMIVFHRLNTSYFQFEIDPGTDIQIQSCALRILTSIIDKSDLPQAYSHDRNIEYINFDLIEKPLIIRAFLPGDKFIPLNMNGHKKVSDFFTDLKVPLHNRNCIPILTCSSGIVWIVGYQIDDRFKITENCKKVLKLEVRKDFND